MFAKYTKLFALLLAVQVPAVSGQAQSTPLDVVHLLFKSLYSDRNDARLAFELKRLKLRAQLSPNVIVYFQSVGLGPRSIASLERLHQRTASLPLPPHPALAIQPIPSEEEQKRILGNAFEYAQSYIHKLPSFVCDQITKRYTNISQARLGMNTLGSGELLLADTLKWTLRFVDGVEVGNVLNTSNPKSTQAMMKPGQSLSRREFGPDLLLILGPDVHPRFGWSHWELSERSRTAVFKYSVARPDSRYAISWSRSTGQTKSNIESLVTAMSGLLFIDADTGTISRLTIEATGIPKTSPIQEDRTVIDYGPIRIAGREYTVPLAASVFLRAGVQRTRNDISFVKYRKLEVTSALKFGEIDSSR